MKSATNPVAKFLWNVAGFQSDIIKETKVDGFHASIIGVLLIIVGAYAALAWTFFFQTVSTSWWPAVLGGVFMGFFIVSFDRALIASMASGKISAFSVIFRLVLATLLGVFLAQPMILKFYEKDINREAQILIDLKNQERKVVLEGTYAQNLDELKAQQNTLQSQIDAKEEVVRSAEQDLRAEMDGSGGTGKRGYAQISKQKERLLNVNRTEYTDLLSVNSAQIDKIQTRIDSVQANLAADFDDFKANNKASGTLIKVEALQSLLNKDETGTLKSRYYLLVLILALIELSALIAKLLFSMDSYKAKVKYLAQQDLAELEDAQSRLKRQQEIINQEVEVLDSESSRAFFAKAKATNDRLVDEMLLDWQKEPTSTFKQILLRFRRQFMS